MSVYPAKKLSRNILFFNFINNGKIECENTQINTLRMGILIKIYDLKNNLEMLFNDTYTDELLGLLKIKNGNTKLFLRKLYISDCIEVNVDKNKIIDIQDVYSFLSQMINYLYENNANIFQGKDPAEKKNILIQIDYNFRVENHFFTEDKKDVYLDITEAVSKRIIDVNYIFQLLGHFTYLYGFTEEDILNAYYRKWKKNASRIGTEWR